MNTLRDTGHFRRSAINHIFNGEINSFGRATGFHYEGISGSQGSTFAGSASREDRLGVYNAKVKVGRRRKKAKSTFFPRTMSPQDVVDAINDAYSNIFYRSETGNTHVGYSWPTELVIMMYLDENKNIISAFPIKDEI